MTLRIQKSTERGFVLFTFTGRIQGDQLPDLEALLKAESSADEVVLDLKDVKLVDRDAVRFLARWETKGSKLRNCAAYIRAWISQERNGMQPDGPGKFSEAGE